MNQAANQSHLNAADIFYSSAKKNGLKEYASDDLFNRFQHFIDNINKEGMTADWARPAAVAQLSKLVCNRLNLERDWQVYPEILDEKIENPLFVLGSGRTGTSAMQSLLSLDNGCRTPLVWQSGHPSPPPGLDSAIDAKHIALENEHMRDLVNIMPGMLLSHPYVDAGAFMETEDEDLFVLDFQTVHPFHLTRVPNTPIVFQNKISGLSDALTFHKKLLQQFQWKQPTQRWICKGTQHHYQIPALWEVYPDALCVWTHRDPVAFIGSVLGIVEHVFFTPITGRSMRGTGIVEQLVAGIRAGYDGVLNSDWLNNEKIIHVRFDDFVHDQVSTIRRIYEHEGREFTTAYETKIKGWLNDSTNNSARHGKYKYSVEEFGLNETDLRKQFADYYECFLK